jgi:nucleotide-binding universal stress UspA family protein
MAETLEQLAPKRVVAYVDEEGSFDHSAKAAVEIARRYGSRVILYDASSVSAFSDPIASSVSADGVEEQFSDPLPPEDLERLGRPSLAASVVDARKEGVDAWGWLPSDHGLDAFWAYARERGADLTIVPHELSSGGALDKVLGERLDDTTLREAPIPVLVVDQDGSQVFAG